MKKIILILILILASALRLWQIGQVPLSLDWDEPALGYNAYSLMLTGKDEYGKSFPVVLESFGDYKPALYAYLIIPFLPVFGLTAVAVRLPSAIIGIGAVLLTYFLAKEFLKRTDVALIATFLLAVSPWHMQFSRVAFESSVGMAFNLAGMLFFVKGLKKPSLLSASAIFFSLSIYTYQSEKLFVPLILLVLIGVYWQRLIAIPKKYSILAVLLLIIISLPITYFTLTNQNGLARAKGVSILSNTNSLLQRNVKIVQKDKASHDLLGQLFDNRRIVYAKAVIQGYLSHFDPNWYFITGDATNRHHVPQMGIMYIIELPFLLLGFYFLLFNSSFLISKKTKLFIILWILVTPIPASFTTGVPHAVRTLNFLPSFQLITAIGIVNAYLLFNKLFKSSGIKLTVQGLIALFFLFNFIFYLNQYFVQQNYFFAGDWNYGYSQLVDFLKPIHLKYKKVIVSNQGYMDQSYIFFLFYQKYDPTKYQAEGGTRSSGIERVGNKFSNYEFRQFNYYDEKTLPVLLVGTDHDLSQEFKVIKRIYFLDGTEAIRVVEKL
jgi:4-amino-4-deoxy-L-arabinose transferase-like glycosyltransferase